MLWGPRLPDKVAHPSVAGPLLERALAANPKSSLLHEKLAYLHLDRYDFPAAAAHLEAALQLDATADHARLRLARCYNRLGRFDRALALLAGYEKPVSERGFALMRLDDQPAAEREFRAVLAASPGDYTASRGLCRLLRKSGRIAELVGLCEELAARGGANAQLLYNWGWALALAGDVDRARRLLFEPDRVVPIDLPPPTGFADSAAFNDALAEEILSNPHRLSDFPQDEEANRGSKRVENLAAGRRPELIDLLLTSLENAAASCPARPRPGFDPWPRAKPEAARLRAWGLLQREGDHEAQHIHPSGWLSGVYYVRVPPRVSDGTDGRGCIEFGPPNGLAAAMPGIAPTARYVPREGLLLLAPSHYPHRTIPSGLAEDRISVAFDVIPDTRSPPVPAISG